jgi:hypothetical protein
MQVKTAEAAVISSAPRINFYRQAVYFHVSA